MYLMCHGRGIVKVKETSFIKKIFCKHTNTLTGSECSNNGLIRISGDDKYTVCEDCGKILSESHTILI
jgi:RNase P subunit RPR2